MKVANNVWLFMLCQALTMSIASFVIFVGSIIGKTLAPDPGLATMPVAAFVLGSAIATLPVILSMRRFQRKRVFLFCALIASLGCVLAMYALQLQSFTTYLLAVVVLGVGLAAGQQYRFAAMESVAVEDVPQAASRVLIGGIGAAFLGPELAVRGELLTTTPYQGSFGLLMVVAILVFLVLFFFNEPERDQQQNDAKGRPLLEILAQPVILVAVISGCAGFAIMSLVMTSTPLHMHFENGHSLVDTKWVIQSHIVAMFLPSFFVPWIIRRIGVQGLISLGIVALLVMVLVIFSRYDFVNYWVSLVLLGIGWNFLFVGGTTLLPEGYRETERFKVQALNDFTIFGIQAVGALLAGLILSKLGWQALLLISLPILALLIVALLYWRKSKHQLASV
ncbi:MAG: MFS transporter [Gammaproteobacteria bacterium]|nr:MFS transporter [Gammaproteobacteria bacterium]MBQ0838952.1 MFS transporter [Gammaproteobacteria bacterium]